VSGEGGAGDGEKVVIEEVPTVAAVIPMFV